MPASAIAIVGATGAVGREALRILAERGVPPQRILPLASERSVDERIPYADTPLRVQSLATADFHGVRVALFCATADVARTHAPRALAAGALVVDNSSAFRLHPDVPLIVPEINPDALGTHTGPRLIANPNCSTILLLMALEPLRRAYGVRAIDVSTYQAVSGAGTPAIDELQAQIRATIAGQSTTPAVFPEPCAFNVFSHDSSIELASGINGEERKMIEESRRIWAQPDLRITPTCVRVPVIRAHTQAITATLARPATEESVRHAYASTPTIRVIDDRPNNRFPTPLKATDGDQVLVGRIRPDPSSPSPEHTDRWCVIASMDQIRKGAALNAIQIVDHLEPGLLGVADAPPRHSAGIA